jgi:hypothetical protein
VKRIVIGILNGLLLIVAIAGLSGVEAGGQSIREVKPRVPATRPAPLECVTTFRALFKYVQKREPSLITDEKARARWLSRLLRKSFEEHIKNSGTPQENPDYPSNQTFVGVWDNPTTFSLIGTRHYDYRNADNRDDNRAVIDVLFEWDKRVSRKSINNYPGEKSLKSFIFVHEDGSWKLDDVYTFSDKFARPESLRAYFEKR